MRTAGLAVLSKEVIEQGLVHHVDLKRPERIIVSPEAYNRDDLVKQLLGGCAVVSECYAEQLEFADRHEVVADKFIAEARSAHGVGFGRFVGRRPSSPKTPERILEVAMKPFGAESMDEAEDAAASAINEVLGYWTLAFVGVETFKPVGIFPSTVQTVGSSKEPNVFVLLTEKDDTLQSLDRDDWVHGFQIESQGDLMQANRNSETIRHIFALKAWLELNGIFHVDGQAKNWARMPGGSVRAIDPENLVVLPLGHEHSTHLSHKVTEKMLVSLMTDDRDAKIYGVGLLSDMSGQEVRQRYPDLMLNPYRQILYDMVGEAGIDNEQAQLLIDGADEHFERAEAEDWPWYLIDHGHGKSK